MKRFSQCFQNHKVAYVEVTKDDIRHWLSNNHRFAEMVKQIPQNQISEYIDQNHNSMVPIYTEYVDQLKRLNKDTDVNVSYDDFVNTMKEIPIQHTAQTSQSDANSASKLHASSKLVVDSMNAALKEINLLLNDSTKPIDSLIPLIENSLSSIFSFISTASNEPINTIGGKIYHTSENGIRAISESLSEGVQALNNYKNSPNSEQLKEYITVLGQAMLYGKQFFFGITNNTGGIIDTHTRVTNPKDMPPASNDIYGGGGSDTKTSMILSKYME